MTVVTRRLHHLALTVTDVDASVPWYEGVFGIKFRMDVPAPGGVGKLLADDACQLMIVLHRHDTNDGDLFTRDDHRPRPRRLRRPDRGRPRGVAGPPRGQRRRRAPTPPTSR